MKFRSIAVQFLAVVVSKHDGDHVLCFFQGRGLMSLEQEASVKTFVIIALK